MAVSYYQRNELLEQVTWRIALNRGATVPFDSIKSIECWDYEGISARHEGKNFRLLTLVHEPAEKGSPNGEIELRVKSWLLQEGIYRTPTPPPNAGRLRGGLRVVLCERPNMLAGMSLSEDCFKLVEQAFSLHSATLPSFLARGGPFGMFFTNSPATGAVTHIHIIAKMVQKVEIANCILSLTHNIQTRWTDALICGEGITLSRPIDKTFGSQQEQLVRLMLSETSNWSSPLLLPYYLLQMCTDRTQIRLGITEGDIINCENELGVTFAGQAGVPGRRDRWPEDINVKTTTKALHSTFPQVVFMGGVCIWLTNYSRFLLGLEERLQKDLEGVQTQFIPGEFHNNILFLQSIIDSLSHGFEALRDRTTSQINLLFSVVSQQDSLVNRRGNSVNIAIARSTKQDSISMSTFTFVTVLFLPGTFIASLFSIPMFNWRNGQGGSSSNSGGGYVAETFWVYWVVTVPLTIITMGGWYLWFRYADKKSQTSLQSIFSSPGEASDPLAGGLG